ncbi:carbon storage regulator [Helicobacter mustelae]|uniref:Translational regulator CsrA n=1 Tax=Helicobacter mustelae (strain ATCC 43772 / CCUG 25715 / CIP 103759 / LMG 18044 / NCTC 12198 / R85-136P) TaxID=679897 RepID=D3UI88_HELM1|nr:carbon storage regulator [Helicobacter mustelae]CBG40211.1 carbon storage regulator homolog [Helicobacter mustelae 12198]SQH71711.1 carbon storage regulator [Helicobacter mustelae]STP12837.1 carbon storage regulator [Helicobacter mustelae]
MLILSRKIEESIVIGDNIVVKVISVDRGSVKLGFEAPADTLILRAELKRAIEQENQKAVAEPGMDVFDALGKHFRH